MRAILLFAALPLAGCVVQAHELNRPQVAARFASAKPAAEFANCVATATGLEARRDGEVYSIIGHNRGGVRVVRWDFSATLDGSEAALRSEDDVDTYEDAVRACV